MDDNEQRGRGKRSGVRQGGFNWRPDRRSASNAKKLERLERFGSEPNVSRTSSWRKQEKGHEASHIEDVADFGFVSKGILLHYSLRG